MATTPEAMIADALFQRLDEFTYTPELPIAAPNVDFPGKDGSGKQKPMPKKFLRVQFNPNRSNARLINSAPAHHMGFLQITVNWPKNKGEIEPREVAGLIAAHFPADLRVPVGTSHIRITQHPYVANLLQGDARTEIPVLISWECWI